MPCPASSTTPHPTPIRSNITPHGALTSVICIPSTLAAITAIPTATRPSIARVAGQLCGRSGRASDLVFDGVLLLLLLRLFLLLVILCSAALTAIVVVVVAIVVAAVAVAVILRNQVVTVHIACQCQLLVA